MGQITTTDGTESSVSNEGYGAVSKTATTGEQITGDRTTKRNPATQKAVQKEDFGAQVSFRILIKDLC